MFTDYFLKLITEDIYKHQKDSTIPHYYYVGISSTTPNSDGSNITEPDQLGFNEYKRIKVDNQNDFSEANDDGIVSNDQKLYFPESRSHWGRFTHYVIYDAPTGGNLLMYGEFNIPIVIPVNTIVMIPADMMQIQIKNA